MSDPSGVVAGVVGILSAAAQILLIRFTRSAHGAPKSAQSVPTEVTESSCILSQLQTYLLGKEAADSSRTALLQVDQVVAIVSGCVLSFSELERLLGGLKTDDIRVIDRVRWARKESSIVDLLGRLQNHKTSLSCILTILKGNGECFRHLSSCKLTVNKSSLNEAKISVDRLCDLVETRYGDMLSRLHPIQTQGAAQIPVNTSSGSALKGDKTQSSLSNVLVREEPEYTADLAKSWVYARNDALRDSTPSLLSADRRSTSWSVLSQLSIADVSNVSVLNLVITTSEVSTARQLLREPLRQNKPLPYVVITMVAAPQSFRGSPFNITRDTHVLDVIPSTRTRPKSALELSKPQCESSRLRIAK